MNFWVDYSTAISFVFFLYLVSCMPDHIYSHLSYFLLFLTCFFDLYSAPSHITFVASSPVDVWIALVWDCFRLLNSQISRTQFRNFSTGAYYICRLLWAPRVSAPSEGLSVLHENRWVLNLHVTSSGIYLGVPAWKILHPVGCTCTSPFFFHCFIFFKLMASLHLNCTV